MTELEYAEFITPSWSSILIFAFILFLILINIHKHERK
jgi:hypothetical protein